MGIQAPNFTQTPNELFDEWLPKLKLVELRVLMVIVRKTFGWHKARDRISLSQLEKATGSRHDDIKKATDKLEKLGLLRKEVEGSSGLQQTFYELIVDEGSNNFYPRGNSASPPRGNSASQKKDFSKEKPSSSSPSENHREEDFLKNKVFKETQCTDQEYADALQKLKSSTIKIIVPDRWLIEVIFSERFKKTLESPKHPEVSEFLKNLPKPENIDASGRIEGDNVIFWFLYPSSKGLKEMNLPIPVSDGLSEIKKYYKHCCTKILETIKQKCPDE